jgi:hypothetical protein
VRDAIEGEPYRVGPRMAKLKRLLAKLEPATERPAVFPPPMPRGGRVCCIRNCEAVGGEGS